MIDHDANRNLKTYGKSFHWARFFLHKNIGTPATSLYGFCRLLDDIADGELPGGTERLIDIDNQIKGVALIKEKQVDQFLKLADKYKISFETVHQLILGLLDDQSNNLTLSQTDLLKYSYRVAGTVGLMMVPILGARDKQAEPFAIDLGIAMQLTNIGRDLLEDAFLGRRYIPASWCQGITPAEIINIAADPGERERRGVLMRSIDRLLLLAESYYKSGLVGLTYLPLRSHLSIGVAAFVYRAIGEQLRRERFEWWRGRQIVGVYGKLAASARFMPWLRLRLNNLPKHDGSLHRGLEEFPGININ